MSKTTRIVLIVIGTLIGIAVGNYMYRAISLERQVSSLSNPTTAPLMSEKEALDEFMAGCMGVDLSGNSFDQKQYCECMVDSLLEDKGVNETIRLGLNVDDPAVMAELETYATTCLARQNIF